MSASFIVLLDDIDRGEEFLLMHVLIYVCIQCTCTKKLNTEIFSIMCLTILDLPNEILCIIFHKLDIFNVLYSFISINQRLDRLALDPFYIRKLIVTTKSFSDSMCSIKDEIVDKLCGDIIPQIHDQVNKLFVEQNLLQRVLHAGSYPRLNSLSLIDFKPRTLLKILTGKLFSLIHFNISTQI